MATNYARGRSFENRVRKYLTKADFFTIRSAGSKGKADLVAISPGGKTVLFVQCKRSGLIDREEWNELLELASHHGALPILARGEERKLILEQIITPLIPFARRAGATIPFLKVKTNATSKDK